MSGNTEAPACGIELNGVSYSPAGSQSPILRNISLAVSAGAVTVVVGPNGAGKSTLLRLLAGLSIPTEGNVSYGRGPYPSDDRARARLFHLVGSEQATTFNFTVDQVVGMGRYPHRGRGISSPLPDSGQALIEAAIDRVDIQHLRQRSVLTLSSGELRRVWIARALVSEAQFLLLDEPTANLDLAHAQSVLELGKSLAGEGRGVVMALHDLQGAFEVADRVVLLHEGGLRAVGDPAEVLSASNVAEVFGVRFATETTVDSEAIPRLRTIAVESPE